MHLAQLLLAAFTIITVAICIPTSFRQWDHGQSYHHRSSTYPSAESSGSMRRSVERKGPDVKASVLWKDKVLMKRNEDDLHASNQPLRRKRNKEAGTPTLQEIKEVLPAETFEKYMEYWENHKAYYRARYVARKAAKRGREVPRQWKY